MTTKTKKQKNKAQAAELGRLALGNRGASASAPEAGTRGRGRPARVGDVRRLVVLLSPEMQERLKVHAAQETARAGRQVTLSRIVQEALEAYLPRG